MAQNAVQSSLNRVWWGIVLRGILAIALGVCVWPAYAICRRQYGGPPAIDPPPTSITA